ILTALLSYDLANGVKYVHTRGRISSEVQGSYSIPLFFPIVSYNGLFLMDPGILELTPTQTAKILGADLVISTTAFDELPY
ncbi:MAG TPA: patatin, partial [Firmicutes bacterium]|nr:patatin [Bacillota bacterium]